MTSQPKTLMSWDASRPRKAPTGMGLKDKRNPAGRKARNTHDTWDSDAYYVRIAQDGDVFPFIDVTAQLGSVCPYSRPLAFAAMRNTDSAITLSVQQLTKKQATRLAQEEMHMPASPLSRLHKVVERVADDLEDNQIWVERAGGPNAMYTYTLDGSGVATLEHVGGEDPGVILSDTGERITLVMKSKRDGKPLGFAYIGYMGNAKPGTPDTLQRCVTKAICNVSGLQAFTLLTGITRAEVPPIDQGATIYREEVSAVGAIPVTLYTDSADGSPQPLEGGSGHVKVTFDLVEVGNSFNIELEPSDEIAPVFQVYHSIIEAAITSWVRRLLGDSTYADIRANIILREVTAMDAETLLEAVGSFVRIEATPTQDNVTVLTSDG